MKKIDKLVVMGFIGPYILSFFVAEFVLLMQFLWKQIDRILGKGVSFFEIMELLFFMAVKLIPMAIPLTILISSVMVFGNMAERYELSSIKSAGISLLRTMKPGILIALGTGVFSIICSNFLVPKANYEFYARFERIKRAKASLTIEEGIFNKDFKGYSIRVDKKEPDGRTIHKIYIADHTDNNKSLTNVTVAEHGEMFVTSDGAYFVMTLYNGHQYKDLKETTSKDKQDKKFSFMRTHFKEWTKVFDMSQFSLNNDLYELNKNRFDLLNSYQLLKGIDSIQAKALDKIRTNHILAMDHQNDAESNKRKEQRLAKRKEKRLAKRKEINEISVLTTLQNEIDSATVQISKAQVKKEKIQNTQVSIRKAKKPDKYRQMQSFDLDSISGFIETLDANTAFQIMKVAKSKSGVLHDRAKSSASRVKNYSKETDRFLYKLHEPYSWALVCIIFLFIGAPLGSIVRKGGYGYPLLFAIIFYMIFMIVVIIGQKLIRSQSIDPILAAWLPCLVLIPVCMFLTIKALNDTKLTDLWVKRWLTRKMEKSA